MLPDFEMLSYDMSGGHDVTIIPIADVHLGAAECMEQEFMAFVDTVAETPNTFVILCGDLLNNAVKNSVSNIYKEQYMPSHQKRMMARMLEPIRDKILCSVEGNHERRSSKDVDDSPVYDIMAKLDIEDRHRENIAFLKLQLGKKETSNGNRYPGSYRPTYVFAVTHGAGGGMLTGSGVNRAERFGFALDGVDALILGHTHKPYLTQPGKIVVDPRNDKVSVKPFRVISVTSWLEYSDYAAQKLLLPTTHALQTIRLSGTKKEMIVTM